VILVNDTKEIVDFAAGVMELAQEEGVRATLDDSNNSVSKKIRNAETAKVPYSVVLGEKEVVSGKLSVRVRTDLIKEGHTAGEYSVESLIETIVKEVQVRANTSLL
jgi:threonyl-tRNA synthetase